MRPVIVGILLVQAGCATASGPPPVARPLLGPADALEYSVFAAGGSLELRGQAFLTTRGGDVKVGAGRMVTLDPATTYSTEWFRRFGGDVEEFGALPPDSRFAAARRTATADADGRFIFSDLAPGTYLLRTTVTWETGARYAAEQGGVVALLVTLDQSGEVILNEVYETSYMTSLGVLIIGEEALRARAFRVIEDVTATSCRGGLIGPEASQAAARDDLVIEAARLPDADAVARVQCREAGMSWTCTSRVICDGIAIAWTS